MAYVAKWDDSPTLLPNLLSGPAPGARRRPRSAAGIAEAEARRQMADLVMTGPYSYPRIRNVDTLDDVPFFHRIQRRHRVRALKVEVLGRTQQDQVAGLRCGAALWLHTGAADPDAGPPPLPPPPGQFSEPHTTLFEPTPLGVPQ